MKNRLDSLVYWTPRVLSILLILLLLSMSLDVFDMDLGLWQIILGLFIHNIPAIFLLITLIISWKYEIVGGIIFILAGLLYIIWLANSFERYMLTWVAVISGPAFLIGILFLIGWFRKIK